MFVGMAGAYPSETDLSGAPLQARLLALLTNNRLSWKGFPESNTLAYY
jgi:hypothetical protein